MMYLTIIMISLLRRSWMFMHFCCNSCEIYTRKNGGSCVYLLSF